MKKTNGFGIWGIIVIMIITAVVSSIATGVIMLNREIPIDEDNGVKITDDKELMDFINIYEIIMDKYYDEIDKKGMLKAAEEGMLDFLGDKYTTFLEEIEYNEIIDELAATYKGIGIAIIDTRIDNVIEGSPAEKVGIEKNDVLISINDKSVSFSTSDEIKELIKQSDDNIKLVVSRNGLELVFNLKKEELTNVAVFSRIIDNTKIGYLQILKFSENLDNQVSEKLKELENEGIDSLIIDVRGNVGGYLSSAEKTSSLFLANGKTIYSLETTNNTIMYKDETKEKRDYEIVVLINSNTASAAEILACALKESYGATLIGVKTYGKGKVQQIIGESAKYTFAKWLTPNGNYIDGIGYEPDYTIHNVVNDETDYQLNKAIELLNN